MKFLTKYGIGIYLLVTLMFKLNFIIPHAITNGIYYFLMVFGLLSFFIYFKSIFADTKIFQIFLIFFSVNALNLIYLLVFDRGTESFFYFSAKFATSNVIILGVVYNYSFYKIWFTKYLKYVMLMMVILGKLFATVALSVTSQRLSIGFNPNDVGLFGMLGVLSIIALDKFWYKKKINIALFLFFVLLTLLSGSKAALLSLMLTFFFRYGFNYRIVVSVFLFLIVAYLSSNFGYVTSLDRLNSNEDVFETRYEAYDAGVKTVEDNIWIGHGLDKYGWTNPKYWYSLESAFGPHNTYLSIPIMYGVPIGIVFMLIIFIFTARTFRKSFRSQDYFIRFCYFVILIVLINGFFETLIVAINEFITLLFWFAVGCVGYDFSLRSKKMNKKNYALEKQIGLNSMRLKRNK